MSVAGQSFRLYLLSPHIRLTLSDGPYSKQSVWTMARAVSVRWEEDSDGGHWKCMQMWHFFTHLHTWPSHQTVYLFIYLPQIFIGVIIIIRVVVCDIYHQFILSAHASAKILEFVVVKLIRIGCQCLYHSSAERNRSESESKDIVPLCLYHYSCSVNSAIL